MVNQITNGVDRSAYPTPVADSMDELDKRLAHNKNPRNWRRPKRKRPTNVLAQDYYYGYEWMVAYTSMGYRNGYIKLDKHHPWFALDYDHEALRGVDVHGGLTYASKGPPGVVQRFSYQWWLGFDCAHAGDAPDPELEEPSLTAVRETVAKQMGGLYDRLHLFDTIRDTEFVQRECISLIKQAIVAKGSIE